MVRTENVRSREVAPKPQLITYGRRVLHGQVRPSAYIRKAWRLSSHWLWRYRLGRGLLLAIWTVSATWRSRHLTIVRFDAESKGYYYRSRGEAVGYTRPNGIPLEHWQQLLHSHFLRHYTPASGDLIIELGAGVGTETVPLSRLVGPDGKVLAVEANPRAASVLKRTLALNGITNVEVAEVAVGDREQMVDFVDEEMDESGFVGASSDVPMIRVSSVFLDPLVADFPRIDLLKVNIEGAELPALRSAPSVLARTRNAVISCHDFKADRTGNEFFRTRSQIQALLLSSGFSMLPSPVDGPPEIRDTIYATRLS